MVNHSDKVNIITKLKYGDMINTNFDSIVNQFGSDYALYALILAQEQLTINHSSIIKSLLTKFVKKRIYFNPFSVFRTFRRIVDIGKKNLKRKNVSAKKNYCLYFLGFNGTKGRERTL